MLRFEALEDRLSPAVLYTVTNSGDNALGQQVVGGSFRDALNQAGAGDSINFDKTVQSINLKQPLPIYQMNLTILANGLGLYAATGSQGLLVKATGVQINGGFTIQCGNPGAGGARGRHCDHERRQPDVERDGCGGSVCADG